MCECFAGSGDVHSDSLGGIKYMDLYVCFIMQRILTVRVQEPATYFMFGKLVDVGTCVLGMCVLIVQNLRYVDNVVWKDTTMKDARIILNVQIVVAIILYIPSTTRDTRRKRLFWVSCRKSKISAWKIYKTSKSAITGKYFALQPQMNYHCLQTVTNYQRGLNCSIVTILSKSILVHNITSKTNLTPFPVVIPSTLTFSLHSRTKSQISLDVTKIKTSKLLVKQFLENKVNTCPLTTKPT